MDIHRELTLTNVTEELENDTRLRDISFSSDAQQREREWDLGIDFPQAVVMAREGWLEQVEEFETHLSLKDNSLYCNSFDRTYDVSGHEIDIDRYLAEEPEHFSTAETMTTREPIEICVESCMASKVPASIALNRGIAIAGIVQDLQRKQLASKISLMSTTASGRPVRRFQITILLKDSHEYLNPAILGFWLGHPAALRRCIFRLWEQFSSREEIRAFGFHRDGSYGHVTESFTVQEGSITIPHLDISDISKYKTPEKARKTVQKHFEDRGLTFSDQIGNLNTS